MSRIAWIKGEEDRGNAAQSHRNMWFSKQEAYICNNIPKKIKKGLQKNWGNNVYKVFDYIDCENIVHCISVRGWEGNNDGLL